MRQFNAGIIGLGNRGTEWVKMLTGDFGFVNIAGLCDVYPDRVERAESILEKTGRPCPALKTGDFRELIASSEIDTVLVFSSWSNHFEAAVCAMEFDILLSRDFFCLGFFFEYLEYAGSGGGSILQGGPQTGQR